MSIRSSAFLLVLLSIFFPNALSISLHPIQLSMVRCLLSSVPGCNYHVEECVATKFIQHRLYPPLVCTSESFLSAPTPPFCLCSANLLLLSTGRRFEWFYVFWIFRLHPSLCLRSHLLRQLLIHSLVVGYTVYKTHRRPLSVFNWSQLIIWSFLIIGLMSPSALVLHFDITIGLPDKEWVARETSGKGNHTHLGTSLEWKIAD